MSASPGSGLPDQPRSKTVAGRPSPGGRLPRIAYFSPLPPTRSGIADYSWELLPSLGERAEITLFVDRPGEVADYVCAAFEVYPIADYSRARWSYDLALYQMGNNVHHQAIYQTALRYPGVVVLHDHGLHHFIAAVTGSDEKYGEYIRDMGYALGNEGVDLAWQIRYGRQPYPLFELPLNERLIDSCLGLIVHSQAVATMINARRPDRPVQVIPQQMTVMPAHSRRSTLNLPPDTVIFASTGQVTAAKQIDLALRAFSRLQPSCPNTAFLIVGEVLEEVNLEGIIRELKLEDKVYIIGFAPDLQAFVDWTECADVVINLRYPTVGETSASALRAMAAGRPLIVFDHGAYNELPDEACLKVRPMDEEGLLAAMLTLATEPERRQAMGSQAVTYIKRYHDPGHVAGQYVDFLQKLLVGIDSRFC